MEFLQGAQKAEALGVSAQEFVEIWKKEMEMKQKSLAMAQGEQNSQRYSSDSFSSYGSVQSHNSDSAENMVGLSGQQQTQVSQQQQLLQEHLQQLQKDIHQLQQQQISMQQQQDSLGKQLLDQVCQLETAVNKLTFAHHQTPSKCAELVSTQTASSQITAQFQELKSAIVSEVVDKMKNVLIGTKATLADASCSGEQSDQISSVSDKAQHLDSKQSRVRADAGGDDIETSNEDDDDSREAKHVFQAEKQDSDPDVGNTSKEQLHVKNDARAAGKMRAVIRDELNGLVAQIQMLFLKSLTSEDLISEFINQVKSQLSHERHFLTDNFQECTTAMAGEISARIGQVKLVFKDSLVQIQENISKLGQFSESGRGHLHELEEMKAQEGLMKIKENQKIMKDLKDEIKVLKKEIREMNNAISAELPVRIATSLHHSLFPKMHEAPQQRETTLLADQTSRMSTDARESQRSLASKFSDQKTNTQTKTNAPKQPVQMKVDPIQKKNHRYSYAWRIHSMSKLLKNKLTLYTDITDVPEGYCFRLQAYFSEFQMNFSLMTICGDEDKTLQWPVDVHINILLQPPSHATSGKHQAKTPFVIYKAKSLRKAQPTEGKTKPEFLYYITQDKLRQHIDENDSLLVHFVIEFSGKGSDTVED